MQGNAHTIKTRKTQAPQRPRLTEEARARRAKAKAWERTPRAWA